MEHYIRDLQITFATATRGQGQIDYTLFHFLRNAGWDWLWECDGYAGVAPNRIPDGNMELAGVGANWSALGAGPALLSKVTTPVHSGVQALEVVSQQSGDGVESALFTSMENLTAYHVAIWALNNTGQPWTVSVDIGTGYAVVGTIPHNAAYALSHFSFTTAAAGTRKLKIEDTSGTIGTIYVSDILVVKSYFEYNAADSWRSGTDGSAINPNQFSSLSYSFIAGDIGKVVCIWDPTNPKNSGAYKITSAVGGVATLDLRSGTAVLTAASGLSWRMIDLTKAPDSTTDTGMRGAGFGLQSPHSSKWRFFLRQAITAAGVWGAPEDTDFDFSTGTFYKTGPSTQNSKQAAYTVWSGLANQWVGMHFMITGAASAGTRRMFLMMGSDHSFFTFLSYDATGGTNNFGHDTIIAGYLGADAYHPGVQEWGFFARWEYCYLSSVYYVGIYFDGTTYRFSGKGTAIDPSGAARDVGFGQLGYGAASLDVVSQSNAGPNRWSGNEWLHRPILYRGDPDLAAEWPSERIADIGVFQGRQNMTALSTFDSHAYIHFAYGLCWKWMGEAIIP